MKEHHRRDRKAVTINGIVHDPDFGQMSPEEHAKLVADIRRKIDEGAAAVERGELIDGKSAFEYLRSLRNVCGS